MSDHPSNSGLEGAFFANREKLLRFLVARGAGDSAEDLLQEMWLKVKAAPSGPVASPLSYLFRMANLLMIDRYRAARQSDIRDREWTETQVGTMPGISDAPLPDRAIMARQQMGMIAQRLDELGPRAAAIFRRHRVDGVPQRKVAEEFGVSLSTVEGDLRTAYAALAELKERFDEA
ncbi:RNA polymerase sigma-70 factor (ECF subfamily) [Altererythrobacter atlanticus]|uniref:RNA polymerase sigma factor n=1 Tax=Croceibacterium atlanticum TaxID=1267766 RepID=UPI00062C45DA|nr:sigma-70 family RNA polymerase sigma factor [Croceibacterium atlanticum]MBB5732440.1 RNA polymerase sigma-70 factor (ECF subfamily) [Croceibacterium atlanticum]